MIRVAIDGLFSPILEGGLAREKLSRVVPEIEAAQRDLNGRRQKDVGFYDAALVPDLVRSLETEAKRLRALADDLLVFGIGGSSLGGQALVHALGPVSRGDVRAHFVDNVDPDTLGLLLERLKPERTAALVITKSGGTVETLAQLLIVRRWMRASLGSGEIHSRLTFVTDPKKGLLRDLGTKEGIRCFDVPDNVGGRYSVLTPVGLLPAAFLGIDIGKIVAGAQAMRDRVVVEKATDNPACMLAAGALLAQRDLAKSQLVMMPYADALRVTSAWFVQLWAESLGKRVDRKGKVVHAGQTPIPAVGATDQHAQLQLFVEGPRDKVVALVQVEKFRRSVTIPDELPERDEVKFLFGRDIAELLEAERRATRAALLDSGTPVLDIVLPSVDEANLGGLLLLLEAACAVTGMAMGIDPFDQPGVEAGKRMALGLLGRAGYDRDRERVLTREALGSAV
jgi:glucose-6-phosphate isomerase